MVDSGKEKHIYALSDIMRSLVSVISKSYTGKYWVRAEIARLNYYPKSGHCYPELVEKADGRIKAQIRAQIWEDDYTAISKKFVEATNIQIADGMGLLFYVSVQIHAVHGLALRVHDIDPSYTLGLMALEKQQVLEKLKHEGVFNLNRKLHLALLPSRLAVISVETSKGYHDFLNIIRADKRNFSIYPKLFPAILQGENAVRSILSQFQAIEENQSEFDLVLIIRGGGGDIGLNCYDNYQLASRIASFPLPVITGIGHSTNETITEMVAWANKITPTDVAYFLINRFATFESGLNRLSQRLVSLTNERLRYLKKDLDYLAQRLALSSGNELRFQNDCLDRLKNGLAKYSEEYIKSQISRLEVDKMRLDLLDPILVIKRGFTITLKNGIPIASVSDIEVGDEIESRTVDGVLFSTINNVKPLEP